MQETSIDIGGLELGCRNYESMVSFYENRLRLKPRLVTSSRAVFGFNQNSTELVLYQTDMILSSCLQSLDHIALKVPSRDVLGGFLHHLILMQIPILGAVDHGVSEAIYLEDPERNRIEIVYERDFNSQDIINNINQKEAPFDYAGVYYSCNLPEQRFVFPDETAIGHVGIIVNKMEKQKEFYEKLLGLESHRYTGKTQLGSQQKPHLLTLKESEAKICEANSIKLSIAYPDCQAIETALDKLENAGYKTTESDQGYLVNDPEGNLVQLVLSI